MRAKSCMVIFAACYMIAGTVSAQGCNNLTWIKTDDGSGWIQSKNRCAGMNCYVSEECESLKC